MAENDGDLGSFLTGFIIGGLIGAGVSVLFAPQSGEETRTLIRDRGIELRDRADVEVKELRTRSEAVIADMQKQADEIQSQVKKAVEDARTRATDAIDTARKPKTEDGESA